MKYLNDTIIKSFNMIPYVKAIIYLLLLIVAVILILRVFKIKSIFKSRGVTSEVSNIAGIKSRDKKIIKYNKRLRAITNIVQKTPFKVAQTDKEYYQYNINRAGLMSPGGMRYLTAEEFNAIIIAISTLVIAVAIIIATIINTIAGIIIIIAVIICASTLPMILVRSTVAGKDKEITDNFSDLYLMLHYVLMMGGNTPLDKIMKSYARTTSSEEMKRFVDTCVSHMDTNGEYNATRLISNDYREIAEVGKLMRLIRQLYDGGDIRQELIGFREELIKSKKYAIERRGNKLVGRARVSFKILAIVLVQAILSAMAIYLPDISAINSLFGPK